MTHGWSRDPLQPQHLTLLCDTPVQHQVSRCVSGQRDLGGAVLALRLPHPGQHLCLAAELVHTPPAGRAIHCGRRDREGGLSKNLVCCRKPILPVAAKLVLRSSDCPPKV